MTNPYAPPDPNKPRAPRPQQPPPRQWQQRQQQRAQEPPPQLTPEEVRSVTGSTMIFGVLMMLTLLAGTLAVPLRVIAPVLGVAAFVHGVRTLMKVRKLRWPGMLSPMLIGGLLLTTLTTMGTTTELTVFWDEQVTLQECRASAVTIAARERCEREWEAARSPSAPSGG